MKLRPLRLFEVWLISIYCIAIAMLIIVMLICTIVQSTWSTEQHNLCLHYITLIAKYRVCIHFINSFTFYTIHCHGIHGNKVVTMQWDIKIYTCFLFVYFIKVCSRVLKTIFWFLSFTHEGKVWDKCPHFFQFYISYDYLFMIVILKVWKG